MRVAIERISKKIILTIAIIITSGALGGTASAFSITGDFSASRNPNGVWTYGWLEGFGGAFTPYDEPTTDTFGGTINRWNDSADPGGRPDVPFVWNNASGALYTRRTAEYESGWAGFHPGINGYASDYRFTAPDTGTYSIFLEFQGADIFGASSDVFVRTNSTVLYSNSVDGRGFASRRRFSGNVSLSAGQVLDIFVTEGRGGINNDSTSIRGNISIVPEPETYAMMMVGLGLMCAASRRRKCSTLTARASTPRSRSAHGKHPC